MYVFQFSLAWPGMCETFPNFPQSDFVLLASHLLLIYVESYICYLFYYVFLFNWPFVQAFATFRPSNCRKP